MAQTSWGRARDEERGVQIIWFADRLLFEREATPTSRAREDVSARSASERDGARPVESGSILQRAK